MATNEELLRIVKAVAKMEEPVHPAHRFCAFCGRCALGETVGSSDTVVHNEGCAWVLAREIVG